MQPAKTQRSLIEQCMLGLHHLPVAHICVSVDRVRQMMPLLIHHTHSALPLPSAASLPQVSPTSEAPYSSASISRVCISYTEVTESSVIFHHITEFFHHISDITREGWEPQ